MLTRLLPGVCPATGCRCCTGQPRLSPEAVEVCPHRAVSGNLILIARPVELKKQSCAIRRYVGDRQNKGVLEFHFAPPRNKSGSLQPIPGDAAWSLKQPRGRNRLRRFDFGAGPARIIKVTLFSRLLVDVLIDDSKVPEGIKLVPLPPEEDTPAPQ